MEATSPQQWQCSLWSQISERNMLLVAVCKNYWGRIYSVVSVCLLAGDLEVPCDHCPWCTGSHCTGSHWPSPTSAWPCSHLCTRDPALEGPATSPARDIWWPSLETCSKLFILGPPLVPTSGGYWNTQSQRKRALHDMLLKCFLIISYYSYSYTLNAWLQYWAPFWSELSKSPDKE